MDMFNMDKNKVFFINWQNTQEVKMMDIQFFRSCFTIEWGDVIQGL